MKIRNSMSVVSQFSDDYVRDDLNHLQFSTQFLLPDQIMKQLENQIEEIIEIFCLDFDKSLLIFNHCKYDIFMLIDRFNMQELQSKFILEKDEVLSKLHITRKKHNNRITSRRRIKKTINCRSCYDDNQQYDSLECGHEFCVVICLHEINRVAGNSI